MRWDRFIQRFGSVNSEKFNTIRVLWEVSKSNYDLCNFTRVHTTTIEAKRALYKKLTLRPFCDPRQLKKLLSLFMRKLTPYTYGSETTSCRSRELFSCLRLYLTLLSILLSHLICQLRDHWLFHPHSVPVLRNIFISHNGKTNASLKTPSAFHREPIKCLAHPRLTKARLHTL